MAEFQSCNGEQSDETQVGHGTEIDGVQLSSSGWPEFTQFVKTIETARPLKSDVDNYSEEGCFICGDPNAFDAL